MRLLCLFGIATVLVGWNAFQAGAETKTFYFTGYVDIVPAELDAQFSVDMPMTGHFTFDTEAADTLDADPRRGNYIASISEFRMVIGGYEITEDFLGDIAVYDGYNAVDSYTAVTFGTGNPVNGFDPDLPALQLTDHSQTVFNNDLLPIEPPPISGFDEPLWTVDFSSDDDLVRLIGRVDTLQVPEPTSAGLLLIGMCLVLVRRWFVTKR